MNYELSYREKHKLNESDLTVAQRTLHFIAENMRMKKSISEDGYKHFQQAIEALEQESCEDAISRQALIKRINNAEENFKFDNMESISSGDEDAFVDGVLSGVFNIRQMVMQAQPVKSTRIEQEHILDKIKAEIKIYEADCRLQGGKHECERCNDSMFGSIYRIIDKYKAESEGKK